MKCHRHERRVHRAIHASFTFQGPSTASPSLFALEGLFTTLCQRL